MSLLQVLDAGLYAGGASLAQSYINEQPWDATFAAVAGAGWFAARFPYSDNATTTLALQAAAGLGLGYYYYQNNNRWYNGLILVPMAGGVASMVGLALSSAVV